VLNASKGDNGPDSVENPSLKKQLLFTKPVSPVPVAQARERNASRYRDDQHRDGPPERENSSVR
jgi:hypothetical protein